jgi:hypothetical protein
MKPVSRKGVYGIEVGNRLAPLLSHFLGLSCSDPSRGFGRVIAVALPKLLQRLLSGKDLPQFFQSRMQGMVGVGLRLAHARDTFCWRRKIDCEDMADSFVTTAKKLPAKP